MAALSVPGSVRFSFVTGRNTTDSWQWTTALPPVTGPDGNGGYLIVVLDGIENLPISGYDEAQAVDRQMGMIALAETVQELPDNCGTILQIQANGTGTVTNHLGETIQVTPIGGHGGLRPRHGHTHRRRPRRKPVLSRAPNGAA